jgi:hypothetical protein
MGTQGLSRRAVWRGRSADRRRIARISFITAALAIVPLLTGCSSLSSSSSASAPSGNQTVAVPPPPNAAAPASAATAPAAQQQANAGNSNTFLNMFRDPPAQDANGYDARASVYPQQPLTDLFKGLTDPRAAPDPSGAGYPLQPLINAPPAQQASMPHPPSTYTPSGQPYVPPQPLPAYTPSGQPYAPPPPPAAAQPANTAPPSGVYPQQSLSDLFKSSGQ